ncbi:MAG: hypothetical protein AAF600_07140 [Bacteroidota bacterium]
MCKEIPKSITSHLKENWIKSPREEGLGSIEEEYIFSRHSEFMGDLVKAGGILGVGARSITRSWISLGIMGYTIRKYAST